MPTAPPPRLKAWSFSTWSEWHKCPQKVRFEKIDKVPYVKDEGPALIRGQEIDGIAKRYVADDVVGEIPEELANFTEEFAQLRKIRSHVEADGDWAFDATWRPVKWFAPNAWVRLKLDAYGRRPGKPGARVIDYKTGKRRTEHQFQLSLYAIGAFRRAPDLERVRSELWYLDLGHEEVEEYHRRDLENLEKDWETRWGPMMADRRFDPKPSRDCNWCPFQKAKGGPCQY